MNQFTDLKSMQKLEVHVRPRLMKHIRRSLQLYDGEIKKIANCNLDWNLREVLIRLITKEKQQRIKVDMFAGYPNILFRLYNSAMLSLMRKKLREMPKVTESESLEKLRKNLIGGITASNIHPEIKW